MTTSKTPRILKGSEEEIAEFRGLADRFEQLSGDATTPYASFRRRPDLPLLVIAAAGVDAYTLPAETPLLLSDTELAEAAQRAGLSGFVLGTADAERLRGALTAVRGAAGEQWVLEQLGNGGIAAPVGSATAELIAFTTPGTDLIFSGSDGRGIVNANVKIANSAQVVVDHFAAHPDVPLVFASSDAAADAARRGYEVVSAGTSVAGDRQVVVDIGRSSADFDTDMLADLPPMETWESFATIADFMDAIPWFSMGAITVRAIRRLQAGEARAGVFAGAKRDATSTIIGASAAQMASNFTSGEPTVALVSMLATTLTHASLAVRTGWREAGQSHRAVADIADEIADRHAPIEPGNAPLSWHRRLSHDALRLIPRFRPTPS